MMDSTFSDRVLAWNNVAIAHLLDGNASDCLEVLRYALSQVQGALQVEAANNGPLNNKRPRSTNKLLRETQFQSLPIENNTSTPHHCGNGTFAFFNRMITLQAKDEHITSRHLLCMLFFNLAVVHHQQGLAQGQSAQLTTALQIYQLAFGVVEEGDFLLGDQQMLLLGLYNNMGHIHSGFSRTAETQACVQWIQQIFLVKQAPSMEAYDFSFFSQYMPLQACQQGNVASAA